jgi:hypothetical protein
MENKEKIDVNKIIALLDSAVNALKNIKVKTEYIGGYKKSIPNNALGVTSDLKIKVSDISFLKMALDDLEIHEKEITNLYHEANGEIQNAISLILEKHEQDKKENETS